MAILAALIPLSCGPPTWIEAPDPAQEIYPKILGALQGQSQTGVPPTADVLLAIFKFPEAPGAQGELSLSKPETAGLPRFGQIQDLTTVLNTPGLYLGVQDGNELIVYLIRVSDPHRIRSETEQAGSLKPTLVTAHGGVVAARLPFAPLGSLRIFEVDNNAVSVVHLDAPLGPEPFPSRGWPGW